MLPTKPEGYVSIIGMRLLNPIIILVETLNSLDPKGPNEVQASEFENGYSASIIILSVLLIESFTNRAQDVRGDKKLLSPLSFVKDIYSSSGFLEQLEELFVLRDAIAHNHIWDAEFYWDEKLAMKLVSAEPRDEYSGDSKFKKVRDLESRTTRILKLNLFPTRICRSDAVIVLKKTVEFLLFLERQNNNYVYLSPQIVKYKGNIVKFIDVVNDV